MLVKINCLLIYISVNIYSNEECKRCCPFYLIVPSISFLPLQAVIVSTMINFGPFIRVQLQSARMFPSSNLWEYPSNRTTTSHISANNRTLRSVTKRQRASQRKEWKRKERHRRVPSLVIHGYSSIGRRSQVFINVPTRWLCGDLTTKRFRFNSSSLPS